MAQTPKFRDTLKNLAANNTLNGIPLSQPYLSIFVKYGIGAKVVAKQPNVAGKGKPTHIVELSSRPGIKWGLMADLPKDAPTVDADAEASTDTVNTETSAEVTSEAASTEVTA